jgi:hypothetical protein
VFEVPACASCRAASAAAPDCSQDCAHHLYVCVPGSVCMTRCAPKAEAPCVWFGSSWRHLLLERSFLTRQPPTYPSYLILRYLSRSLALQALAQICPDVVCV